MHSKNIYFHKDLLSKIDAEATEINKSFSAVVKDRVLFSYIFDDLFYLYKHMSVTKPELKVSETLKKLVLDRIENKEATI